MIRYTKASRRLTTAIQTLYTVPDDVDTAVVAFGVCNNVGTTTTLTLHVVDAGGSANSQNQYMSDRDIGTDAPDPLDAITGMVMESGDYIAAVAGAADLLNLRLSIMEITRD